jgi:AbrB family looped-hinge helix DNA binding protein
MAEESVSPVILSGMTSRVGPKGQVVIPKALRDELGIGPGDEVVFSIEDGAVLVEPVKEWRSLKGYLKGKGLVAELEADHRWEIERGK